MPSKKTRQVIQETVENNVFQSKRVIKEVPRTQLAQVDLQWISVHSVPSIQTNNMTATRLTTAVALAPTLYAALFPKENHEALADLAVLKFQEQDERLSQEDLIELIQDCETVISGWGTPSFNAAVLDAAPNLKMIAHSAGSIKRLLPRVVFERGIKVVNAAGAIAPAVAEMTILLMLMCRRNIHRMDQQMKQGVQWPRQSELGLELSGSRVGVIGAGHTGRNVIRLLHAFDVEIWVYDPYLPPDTARELGIIARSLEDIMSQCPIITVQAPPTAETRNMISREMLDTIQDGALFINTARSHVVDADALYESLRENRYQAALDVFDTEPLPADSRLRNLPNVTLTPHTAGQSANARIRQGALVVEQLRLYACGKPLTAEVTQEMLSTMA